MSCVYCLNRGLRRLHRFKGFLCIQGLVKALGFNCVQPNLRNIEGIAVGSTAPPSFLGSKAKNLAANFKG